MRKVVGFVLGLLPVYAFAECVPVPDCASIGYTETSCDGDSLKCPFDNTKLKCFPCDSSFRFSCEGNNIVSAVGDACNGKYVSCGCVAGAEFINGECVCNNSCSVGNIYYSDGTCSSCNVSDKIPVGVIVSWDAANRLLMGLEQTSMIWSDTQVDENGTQIIYKWVDLPEIVNAATADLAKEDYNGFNNTKAIVEAYGENAKNVAAVYCYNYEPIGWEETKGKWYMPAGGELYNLIYLNKDKIDSSLAVLEKTLLALKDLYSSTERNDHQVWRLALGDGEMDIWTRKDAILTVRCLLAL